MLAHLKMSLILAIFERKSKRGVFQQKVSKLLWKLISITSLRFQTLFKYCCQLFVSQNKINVQTVDLKFSK